MGCARVGPYVRRHFRSCVKCNTEYVYIFFGMGCTKVLGRPRRAYGAADLLKPIGAEEEMFRS